MATFRHRMCFWTAAIGRYENTGFLILATETKLNVSGQWKGFYVMLTVSPQKLTICY